MVLTVGLCCLLTIIVDIELHHNLTLPSIITCSSITSKSSNSANYLLALGHADGTITTWDISGITAVDKKFLALHNSSVVAVAFSSDNLIISAASTGVVSVYNLLQQCVVHHVQMPLNIVNLYLLPKQAGVVCVSKQDKTPNNNTFQASIITVPTLQTVATLVDGSGNLVNLHSPHLQICGGHTSIGALVYDLAGIVPTPQKKDTAPNNDYTTAFWSFLLLPPAERYHHVIKQLM